MTVEHRRHARTLRAIRRVRHTSHFVDALEDSLRPAFGIYRRRGRFLEELLSKGHVLSIKSRKVGLSTLVCAHAAWTARIRDVNATVHLLSYREDAAQELLRALKRG